MRSARQSGAIGMISPLLLLLLACSLPRAARAYPSLYADEVAKGCADQPTKGYGGHPGVAP
jgi:hypothetical protein